MNDIIERINAAIVRIAQGHAPMRIPADAHSDADIVLGDAATEIARLRAEMEEARRDAQVAPVLVGLLRELIQPLEVTAALIEDEDGGERFETLLGHVRAAVEHWDRRSAAIAAQGAKE